MEPAAVHFHHGNYSASAADSQPALYDKDDGMEYSTSLTNTTGDYGYYYYYDDYYFEIYPFEINTLGIVLPILVGLTTLSNVFVAGFFLTRKDRGKSTNLLFVSIAFSDTMTGITLLPNAFGVYAKNLTLMSKETCNMYMLLRFYFSPVFHTVSVWQTVVLCIQRYLCVCHPFISGRICTFRNTFISIVVMYILAIVLHVYHLLDNKIGHFRCRWRTETPCKESCMYLWFCVVLQHLLPCILLVVLTLITILKLATAQKRVSTMAHRSRSANRSARDKIITYTAALIVVFFLLPEFPHGVYKLVFVIYKHSSGSIPAIYNHIIISVYELFLTVSFCANFWIYCCMMRDFRRKLLELITCGSIKLGFDRLRSFSASSKRGSVRTTLSRSSSNASRNRVFSRTTSLHSTASENIHAVIPMTPTRGYDHVNFHEPFFPDVKMQYLCKITWRTKGLVLNGRILCLSKRETNFKQSCCVSLHTTNDKTIEGQKCSHSSLESRKFVVIEQVCVSSNFGRKFSTSNKCLSVNVDPNKNYYHILGVTPSCSITKVKQAYYRLSKVYHPDVNKTKAATERFHELTEAYEVLSNPSLRHIYDSGRIGKLHGEHKGTVKPHPVNFSAKGPHQIRKNSKHQFDKQMKSNYSKTFQRFHEDIRKHEVGKALKEERKHSPHSDDSLLPLLIVMTAVAGIVYALYVKVKT